MEALMAIAAFVLFMTMLLGIMGICGYMVSLLFMAMKGMWLILYSGNKPMRIATDPKILDRMQKDTERLLNAREREESYGRGDSNDMGFEADHGVDLEYHRMGGH